MRIWTSDPSVLALVVIVVLVVVPIPAPFSLQQDLPRVKHHIATRNGVAELYPNPNGLPEIELDRSRERSALLDLQGAADG